MPIVNNQIGYPIAGNYQGTTLIEPAVIPDQSSIVQVEPNIVASTSSVQARANIANTSPVKTISGFGIIEISGQNSVVAEQSMDVLTLVAGNNITLTTNTVNSSITINSAGGGGSGSTVLGGNSISVVDNGNSTVTVNNTMTETVYNGGNATTSITPNRNNGSVQKFTLTNNFALNVPTNMSAGQSLTLILTQDSTGSRLMNANTAYLFASGFQTLSTTSGAIDMLNIFTDGTTYYATLTVDYS